MTPSPRDESMTTPRIGSLFSGYAGLDLAAESGLPAGWVTDPDIGLTHVDQLRVLGNGVVPQQAEYATRTLLGAAP